MWGVRDRRSGCRQRHVFQQRRYDNRHRLLLPSARSQQLQRRQLQPVHAGNRANELATTAIRVHLNPLCLGRCHGGRQLILARRRRLDRSCPAIHICPVRGWVHYGQHRVERLSASRLRCRYRTRQRGYPFDGGPKQHRRRMVGRPEPSKRGIHLESHSGQRAESPVRGLMERGASLRRREQWSVVPDRARRSLGRRCDAVSRRHNRSRRIGSWCGRDDRH